MAKAYLTTQWNQDGSRQESQVVNTNVNNLGNAHTTKLVTTLDEILRIQKMRYDLSVHEFFWEIVTKGGGQWPHAKKEEPVHLNCN